MNSALLGQLRALNVVRSDDVAAAAAAQPFQGCADLDSLPATGPARRDFVAAIVARLDPEAMSEPAAHDYLDSDWPTLMPSYLDQLARRKSLFLPDFVSERRFLPSIIALVRNRATALRALRILLNVVASCDTPSVLCRRFLRLDLAGALNHVFVTSDSPLDSMLQAAELLAIVTMFSGDRRADDGDFIGNQGQLGLVAARGFLSAQSLYEELLDSDTGIECYRSRLLEISDANLQFDWERSPRLVAKLIESISRSFLFLHTTATEPLTTLFMDAFEDGTPPMADMALRCLSANGGVLPALPITVTGSNLADVLAVICHLDPLFALDDDTNRIHFPSEDFLSSCQKRWRFQKDCIMHLLKCDGDEGHLIHELVHWIATDPRSKPRILEGRKRFHPESDLGEESIVEFIGQILSTTQSSLSFLSNISRVQPVLTAVASELVVFYQSLSALGTGAYGDDVRLIGYETTGAEPATVCVHVTPTIFEGLAMLLVNQHFRHGEPLAIEASQLEVIARTTASEAKTRGNELIASGQLDAAIAAYTTAINLLDFNQFKDADEFAACIANRSECFLRKQDYRSAYVDASRALQLRPDNAKFQRRFETAKSKC